MWSGAQGITRTCQYCRHPSLGAMVAIREVLGTALGRLQTQPRVVASEAWRGEMGFWIKRLLPVLKKKMLKFSFEMKGFEMEGFYLASHPKSFVHKHQIKVVVGIRRIHVRWF